MKTTATKTLSLSAIAALALGGFTANTSIAASCDSLVQLAHQLDAQLEKLKEDLASHYKHTPQFDHIREDVRAMLRQAEHIDQLSHSPYTPAEHFAVDVAEIDKLSHHLHALVDRAEKSGRGHVHGNTKLTHQLLASVTATIHAMSEQIAVMRRPVRNHNQYSQYGNRAPVQQTVQYRPQAQNRYTQPSYNAGYAQQNYTQPNYGYAQPSNGYAQGPATTCNIATPTHNRRRR